MADLFKIWIFPDTHPLSFGSAESLIGQSGLVRFHPAAEPDSRLAEPDCHGVAPRRRIHAQLIAILVFLGPALFYQLYAREVRPYAWALLLRNTAVTTMTLCGGSQGGLAMPLETPQTSPGFGLSLLLLS